MSALVDSRKSLRRELLTRRSGMSVAEREQADASLRTHLLSWLRQAPVAAATPWVAWYWPIQAEPDLRPIWDAYGRPALPVVRAAGAALVFAPFESADGLVRDAAGVPAPTGPVVEPELIIVPCLGFFARDGHRVRLGYGGGYYDRTLPRLSATALGVAYDWGRLENFRPEAHDAPLAAIVTDRGVY